MSDVARLPPCSRSSRSSPAGRLAPARGERRTPRVRGARHVNPAGGYSPTSGAHGGYAYLSSYRGRDTCPAHGVRVSTSRNRGGRRWSRASARSPGRGRRRRSSSASRRPAFTGDLAVTSVQACRPTGLQGFGLYDVTDPRASRAGSPSSAPSRAARTRSGSRCPAGARLVHGDHPLGGLRPRTTTSGADRDAAGRAGLPHLRRLEPARPRARRRLGRVARLGVHPNHGLESAGQARRELRPLGDHERAGTRAYLSYWDLGTVILDIRTRPRRGTSDGRLPSGADGNAHSALAPARRC